VLDLKLHLRQALSDWVW